MTNIKEAAQSYEPKKTLTIDELEKVSVDIEIKEVTKQDSDGEDFTYSYIEVEDKEYRVPNSVLEQLKTQIESNPDLKNFKVDKKGEGFKTIYTVVPLID